MKTFNFEFSQDFIALLNYIRKPEASEMLANSNFNNSGRNYKGEIIKCKNEC